MAGQLKEVRNRIKSVSSTQQITKAMKMVSAAKLRRAQDYAVPITQILLNWLNRLLQKSMMPSLKKGMYLSGISGKKVLKAC